MDCRFGVGLIKLEDGEGAVAEELGIEYPRSGLNGVLGTGIFTASAAMESAPEDITESVEGRSAANGLRFCQTFCSGYGLKGVGVGELLFCIF